MKAAEFRQRQLAAQQLLNENKLSIPQPTMIQQQQQPPQIPRSATPSSSALASSSSTSVPPMIAQQQQQQQQQQQIQQVPRPASQPSHDINSNN